MKLGELAHIMMGIKLDPEKLTSFLLPGKGYAYLRKNDLGEKPSIKYVDKKTLNKISLSNNLLLQYGDVLLYEKEEGEFKLYRYENPSGQTLPSNDFFIIRSDYSIVSEYFSFESNIKTFCDNLKNIKNGNIIDVADIKNIELYTNNITELEQPNEAEELGLNTPLKDENIDHIKITEKPLPLSIVLKDIKDGLIMLDTEFQRRPGLWDEGRKSRLIESMILKLPIPAFYFDASNPEWRIIDGLQRLSAAYEFIIEKKFVLTNLDYLPSLEGKTYDGLERLQQRNIDQYSLFVYIVEKGTPKSIIYKMFRSINTSALTLEAQEIRHAIHPGKPAKFLKRVVENDWFKKCVPLSDRQRDRMYDREIVLRFIAFKLTNYIEYTPNIVDFLDSSMTKLYEVRVQELENYEAMLEKTLSTIKEILGEYAYSRQMFDEKRAYRFNPILFEVLTHSISKLTDDKKNILLKNKKTTADRLKSYFKNKPDNYWENDKAYTQQELIKRFGDMEAQIKNLTN